MGLLLSVSAGVRVTAPLLLLATLAWAHQIALPEGLAWLSTLPTLVVLSTAAVVETLGYFIPVVSTGLKAAATPLAFVAGTLLMAAPLGTLHNPIIQWTLAAFLGGGTSTVTHVGVTALRALMIPAEAATGGLFSLVWNVGELAISWIFSLIACIAIVFGITICLITIPACLLLLAVFWKSLAQSKLWRLKQAAL